MGIAPGALKAVAILLGGFVAFGVVVAFAVTFNSLMDYFSSRLRVVN